MSKRIAKKLSAKRGAELLKAVPHLRDEEYEALISGHQGFILEDGRLLAVTDDGLYWLWPSRDDCIASMRNAREAPPEHLLSGLFTSGEDFPSYIEPRINLLAQRLKLPQESLDRSLASLNTMDAALHCYGQRKALKARLFEALVAYVGEVIRTAVNGRWIMRLYGDGRTWEPWIVDADGAEYAPFMVVYKELDSDEGFSIQGATEGEIMSKHRGLSKHNR